jgi:hypothetical protein
MKVEFLFLKVFCGGKKEKKEEEEKLPMWRHDESNISNKRSLF